MRDPVGVATSLVPPCLAFNLNDEWVFAHPKWWIDRAVEPDIVMDRNAPRGNIEEAVVAFWTDVAPCVVWPRIDTGAVLKTAKVAEKEREAKANGAIDLF
jgi:hypothetical protein